jgi:pilus assembly protein Flp/PilA
VGGCIDDAANPWIKSRSKIMTSLVTRFIKNESGATAIEYGLIAGFISVAIIAALTLMRPQLQGIFTDIATALTTANAAQ